MTERWVSLAEIKEMLEKAEGERGELSYEQKLSLEHSRKFARFSGPDAKKLLAELTANSKIDHTMAIRILDLAPRHVDDLRALLAKTRVNLDEGELQKVLESVAKYAAA